MGTPSLKHLQNQSWKGDSSIRTNNSVSNFTINNLNDVDLIPLHDACNQDNPVKAQYAITCSRPQLLMV